MNFCHSRSFLDLVGSICFVCNDNAALLDETVKILYKEVLIIKDHLKKYTCLFGENIEHHMTAHSYNTKVQHCYILVDITFHTITV